MKIEPIEKRKLQIIEEKLKLARASLEWIEPMHAKIDAKKKALQREIENLELEYDKIVQGQLWIGDVEGY